MSKLNSTMTNIITGAIGGVGGVMFILAEAVITGKSSVELQDALAVGLFVGGIVWWMSKKFQRIDDTLAQMKDELASRPCQANVCPVKHDKEEKQ